MEDLKEIFGQIKRYDMRLNPAKCVFGVVEGKFLWFMLTSRGVKANLDKCTTILDMRSPRNLKEV